MYKVILILITLALCIWAISVGAEKEHKRWCEQQRYNVENTGQQWTPMTEDMCGEF